MKTKRNDSAQPVYTRNGKYIDQFGLTKREHFAALILQGLVANGKTDLTAAANDMGQEAVARADALIAALNVETDSEV